MNLVMRKESETEGKLECGWLGFKHVLLLKIRESCWMGGVNAQYYVHPSNCKTRESGWLGA